MDERVQQLRPEQGHYYISIAPSQLARYAVGERLFVFIHSRRQFDEEIQTLNRWEGWNRLPAVQTGKVHYLESLWNLDDALTSKLALERFPYLWA